MNCAVVVFVTTHKTSNLALILAMKCTNEKNAQLGQRSSLPISASGRSFVYCLWSIFASTSVTSEGATSVTVQKRSESRMPLTCRVSGEKKEFQIRIKCKKIKIKNMDRSFFSILSQITRLTDRQTRQTDRILIARPRLHCMHHGKNICPVSFRSHPVEMYASAVIALTHLYTADGAL